MAASEEHKEAILAASKAGRVEEVAAILGAYGPEGKRELTQHQDVVDYQNEKVRVSLSEFDRVLMCVCEYAHCAGVCACVAVVVCALWHRWYRGAVMCVMMCVDGGRVCRRMLLCECV